MRCTMSEFVMAGSCLLLVVVNFLVCLAQDYHTSGPDFQPGRQPVYQTVTYTNAVLNQPQNLPIRRGSIEWPMPLTYEGYYENEERIWWYIPVPAGWTLRVFITWHHMGEMFDSITFWKVARSNCNSTACFATHMNDDEPTALRSLTGEQLEHELVFNQSLLVEFNSDSVTVGKGFKFDWIAHPAGQTFLGGRFKRFCCSHLIEWNAMCRFGGRFARRAEEYCSCRSYEKQIASRNTTQIWLRLRDVGRPAIDDDFQPVHVVIREEGEDLLRTVPPDDSYSPDHVTLTFSNNIKLTADCFWSYILEGEWYLLREDVSEPFSNEISFVKRFHMEDFSTFSSTTSRPTTTVWYPGRNESTSWIEHKLYDLQGVITSPNYPQSYPRNARISWEITLPDSKYISLTFQEFNTEAGYDKLTIVDLDEDKTVLILDGKQHVADIHIMSAHLAVNFTSDGSVEHSGFHLMYSSSNARGSSAAVTLASTTVRSPTKHILTSTIVGVAVAAVLVFCVMVAIIKCYIIKKKREQSNANFTAFMDAHSGSAYHHSSADEVRGNDQSSEETEKPSLTAREPVPYQVFNEPPPLYQHTVVRDDSHHYTLPFTDYTNMTGDYQNPSAESGLPRASAPLPPIGEVRGQLPPLQASLSPPVYSLALESRQPQHHANSQCGIDNPTFMGEAEYATVYGDSAHQDNVGNSALERRHYDEPPKPSKITVKSVD